jgi:1L-myo-inositol 1-phosphate cytidylyltransferase / CDP-L-myo-inositol myo-inositolphosphotransferase
MQLEASRSATPAASSLVLLPAVAAPDASAAQLHDGELNILGLSLTQRAVEAARRAGYGQVFLLARDRAAPARAAAVADWRDLLGTIARSQGARLIIAPETILSETDWLTRVAFTPIEPANWAAIPGRIVLVASTAVADAVAMLQADGPACDMTAVQERLERRFGPAGAIPREIDPVTIAKPEDIRQAERRLLRSLVKDTDGFMARHFDRHISLQISRLLAPTRITPSQITLLSIGIGLWGALLFLSPLRSWQTIGGLLLLLHSIVDGCDGELARLKFQESKFGGVLDFWGDNIVHVAVFGCMALGWSMAAGTAWPLWLGAAAVVSTLGMAGLVYLRQLRGKNGSGPLFTSVSSATDDRLTGIVDAASRRDFIYLVPIFALLGKSSWILIAAAVGAPIFLVFMVILTLRERLQSRPIHGLPPN